MREKKSSATAGHGLNSTLVISLNGKFMDMPAYSAFNFLPRSGNE
jgi:hypothetical protein